MKDPTNRRARVGRLARKYLDGRATAYEIITAIPDDTQDEDLAELESIMRQVVVRRAVSGQDPVVLRFRPALERLVERLLASSLPVTATFLRFASHLPVQDSPGPLGVIWAADELRNSGTLVAHEAAQLDQLFTWFNQNLPVPNRFNRSSRPHRKAKALSWFKPAAITHISKARELVAILDEHGVTVRELQEQRPGYIVYEDEWQVLAEPYADSAL